MTHSSDATANADDKSYNAAMQMSDEHSMLASRDDIIQCYRLLLKRDPESEAVMTSRLSTSPTIWKIIADVLESSERKRIEQKSYCFSFEKCLKHNYLANNIDKEVGIYCFTSNMNFLRERLTHINFLDLMQSKIEISQFEYNGTIYFVNLRFSRVIVNEGELSLRFFEERSLLYEMHFSFIRGDVVGSSQADVILISRMQVNLQNAALLKQATKACGDLTPKTYLLSIILGIAEASSIKEIYGVKATNQVCYSELRHDIFHRSYDEFFSYSGFTGSGNGFYKVDVPLQQKPLSQIASWHRLRAKKRRQLRRTISEAARDGWIALTDRRP